MADIVSSSKRSQMMAGIKGKDTKPEMIVRRLLHKQGFRYRLHDKKLAGKPDLVLPRYHVAIFVNGCFWHGHDNCHLYRVPRTRTEFWANKISDNIARDQIKTEALLAAGWRVMVVWECALKGKKAISLDNLADAMIAFITSSESLSLQISS